jgi:hypothetical protein
VVTLELEDDSGRSWQVAIEAAGLDQQIVVGDRIGIRVHTVPIDTVFGTWGSVRIDKDGELLAAVSRNDGELIGFARSFAQACRLPNQSCKARAWSGQLTLGEHSAVISPGASAEVGDFTAMGFVVVPEIGCPDSADFYSLRVVRRTEPATTP